MSNQTPQPELDASNSFNFEQKKLEIELEKLRLEKIKNEQDFEIKKEELQLQKAQSRKWVANLPIWGGLITLIVSLIGFGFQGWQNVETRQREQESAIILEAIKTDNVAAAACNLKFFAETNLIQLQPTQLQQITQSASSTCQTPVLPPVSEPLDAESLNNLLKIMDPNLLDGDP